MLIRKQTRTGKVLGPRVEAADAGFTKFLSFNTNGR